MGFLHTIEPGVDLRCIKKQWRQSCSPLVSCFPKVMHAFTVSRCCQLLCLVRQLVSTIG